MPGSGRGGRGRNKIRVDIHTRVGGGSGSRRGTVDGTHSHIRGGGSGQGCGGGCGCRRGVAGHGRSRHREVVGRVAAKTSSSMGVGSRRRVVGSLMGCAGRGKGTTVGDGGGGLARSNAWRFRLCHPRMVSTGDRRQARPPMGSAVTRRGTTVGDGGDGLVRSRGRRAPAFAIWRWQRRLCVFRKKADGCPVAIAAAVAGITAAPYAKAVGAEKWEMGGRVVARRCCLRPRCPRSTSPPLVGVAAESECHLGRCLSQRADGARAKTVPQSRTRRRADCAAWLGLRGDARWEQVSPSPLPWMGWQATA